MTESETVKFVDQMEPIEKLKVYMNYYVNMLYSKYTSEYIKEYGIDKWRANTFEQFIHKSNVQERGYALRCWINLTPGSIYHYVYHSIK